MPENHDKPLTPACSCSKHVGDRYYTELIRIITGLFIGVLALMTFLLTVGFQRPHVDFAWALYASIVTLSLNLIAFVVAHMFAPKCVPLSQSTDSEVAAKEQAALDSAKKRRKIIRIVQQVLFIAAVIAITWLALSTAHFFFNVQPAAAPSPAPQ